MLCLNDDPPTVIGCTGGLKRVPEVYCRYSGQPLGHRPVSMAGLSGLNVRFGNLLATFSLVLGLFTPPCRAVSTMYSSYRQYLQELEKKIRPQRLLLISFF